MRTLRLWCSYPRALKVYTRVGSNTLWGAAVAPMKGCPQWCTYGVANGLIYVAGAVFISRGAFQLLQMIQVLNLIVC